MCLSHLNIAHYDVLIEHCSMLCIKKKVSSIMHKSLEQNKMGSFDFYQNKAEGNWKE